MPRRFLASIHRKLIAEVGMWIKKEIFPYILLYLNFLTMIMNYLLSFVLFFKEQKLCPAPSDVCHQEILWATLFLPASQVTVMGSSLEPQQRSLPWSPQSAFSVSPELLQQLTRRESHRRMHTNIHHTRARMLPSAPGLWGLAGRARLCGKCSQKYLTQR